MALAHTQIPDDEADDERPAPRRFLGGYRRTDVDDLVRDMQAEIDLYRDRTALLERRLADATARAAGVPATSAAPPPADATATPAVDADIARSAAVDADVESVLTSARKFAARIVTEAEREADLKRRAIAADLARLHDERARLDAMVARFDKAMNDTRAALRRAR